MGGPHKQLPYSKLSKERRREADEIAEVWFKANAGHLLAATFDRCRADGLDYAQMPAPIPTMYLRARREVLVLV